MLHNEPLRNLLLLIAAVVFVLGFFFVQQNKIVTNVVQPTPTPVTASSGNILVSSPYSEASVPRAFLVQGKARVPTNVVTVRVSNKVLGKIFYEAQTPVQPQTGSEFGGFAIQAFISTDNLSLRPNDKMTLEVFHTASDSEEETDKVTFPLYFSPELP